MSFTFSASIRTRCGQPGILSGPEIHRRTHHNHRPQPLLGGCLLLPVRRRQSANRHIASLSCCGAGGLVRLDLAPGLRGFGAPRAARRAAWPGHRGRPRGTVAPCCGPAGLHTATGPIINQRDFHHGPHICSAGLWPKPEIFWAPHRPRPPPRQGVCVPPVCAQFSRPWVRGVVPGAARWCGPAPLSALLVFANGAPFWPPGRAELASGHREGGGRGGANV